MNLSPQARRVGIAADVYCTKETWNETVACGRNKALDVDSRIYGLVDTVANAIALATAKDHSGMVVKFTHWRVPNYPKKKKARPVHLEATPALSHGGDNGTQPVAYILIYMPE